MTDVNCQNNIVNSGIDFQENYRTNRKIRYLKLVL